MKCAKSASDRDEAQAWVWVCEKAGTRQETRDTLLGRDFTFYTLSFSIC
jgi:hypothetical protein